MDLGCAAVARGLARRSARSAVRSNGASHAYACRTCSAHPHERAKRPATARAAGWNAHCFCRRRRGLMRGSEPPRFATSQIMKLRFAADVRALLWPLVILPAAGGLPWLLTRQIAWALPFSLYAGL